MSCLMRRTATPQVGRAVPTGRSLICIVSSVVTAWLSHSLQASSARVSRRVSSRRLQVARGVVKGLSAQRPRLCINGQPYITSRPVMRGGLRPHGITYIFVRGVIVVGSSNVRRRLRSSQSPPSIATFPILPLQGSPCAIGGEQCRREKMVVDICTIPS